MTTRAIRIWRIVAVAAALFVLVVGGRRLAHHAQLELVPVIVAPGSDVQAVLHPGAGALVGRLMRDVRDFVAPPSRPRIAVLTFDDGPYPVGTPVLLAKLHALGVPADFFLIGADARAQPAIAARVKDLGMEIGNHTLTHPEMSTLTPAAQTEEIVDGAATIERATGSSVAYFRPPHGKYDAATLSAALAANESVALWDVDPGDWRTLTPDQVALDVAAKAKSPAVILLHNGKEATVEALERIVSVYRKAGFRFVTLSELQRALPLDAINDPIKVTL